jgi:hypothetical protein
MRRCRVFLGVCALVAPIGVVVGHVPAGAGPLGVTICGGTVSTPAVLSGGTYASVEVTGVCEVRGGQVLVTGSVTVDPGAALVTAFATIHDAPGTSSGLTVDGDLVAGTGAALILGCEPSHFDCLDGVGAGTSLQSTTTVHGSLTATDPLGVVVHHSTVDGNLVSSGGGPGVVCASTPSNIFSTLPGEYGVVFSDVEDTTVGANLRITDLRSCWIGVVRDSVGGSATFSNNTFQNSDADEILNNHVGGNMFCTDLVPSVQFGDSGQGSNVIGGYGTGDCSFSRLVPYPATNPVGVQAIAVHRTPSGYWLAAADGGIFSFGVPFLGSGAGSGRTPGGFASTPGGIGYQFASSSGAITTFGPHAACTGSIGSPNQPMVGMAAAPAGDGCWMVSSDGGIFSFGVNAPFFGSAGALPLNRPVVGLAPSPGGNGYYLVASDGGIFSFGAESAFRGSMGGQHLNQPIVGMAVDPSNGGYYLVASDGGIFSFGAPFFGSLGALHLNKPIVGIAAAPTGDGYYLVASDGGVFAFGPGAVFQGSTGALTLDKPIFGMTLG